MEKWLKAVKFNDQGLIPAVIQDAQSGDVLMLAYMNQGSLQKTVKTGITYFWSRSRKKLWKKGESSGHIQEVKALCLDCDADTLLIRVEQTKVACHTGRWSCFYRKLQNGRWLIQKGQAPPKDSADILDLVYQVILDRKKKPRKDSYVNLLLKGGKDRILRKIGEEAGELIIGSKNNKKSEVVSEMADLWFHSLILLGHHGIKPEALYAEFQNRFGKSGIKEKQTRKGGR